MSRIIEGSMAAAALASIILISAEYLVDLSPQQLLAVYAIDLAIVSAFAVEFVVQLKRGKDRTAFIKAHWYEVFAMLPAILFVGLEAEPSLGAALRSLRVIRVLRLVGMASRFIRLGSATSEIIRRSKLLYLVAFTTSAIFLSTVGIYLMERDVHRSQINSLWEALWWSINTISTVAWPAGQPVTPQGRLLASVMIFVGVAFVGIFTSLLVTSLVERRLKGSQPVSLKSSLIREITQRLERFEELPSEEIHTLKRLVDALCEERLAKLTSG